MFASPKLNQQWILKCSASRGTWAAQSVEPPTLDFGSGRDLTVVGSSSMSACLRFPLSVSLPLPRSLPLKLKKNKEEKKENVLNLGRVGPECYLGKSHMNVIT